MEDITRRNFLQLASAASFTALFPSLGLAAIHEAPAVINRRMLLPHEDGKNFHVLDVGTQRIIRTVETGLIPHSFVPTPGQENIVWCLERSTSHETSLAQVDINDGRILQKAKGGAQYDFRGHGFFAPGGDVLFVSCTHQKRGEGHLHGYDPHTGKLVADYRVASGGTHECRSWSDGTAIVAVDNGKDEGGILHVDLENGKTLSYLPLNQPDQTVNHMAVLSDGTIIAIGDARGKNPAAINVGKLGDASLRPLQFKADAPHREPGEAFGVAVNEKNKLAAVTDRTNNLIIIVDLATMELVRAIPFNVWNVAYDKRNNVFITTGNEIGVLDGKLRQVEKLGGDSSLLQGPFRTGHTLFI